MFSVTPASPRKEKKINNTPSCLHTTTTSPSTPSSYHHHQTITSRSGNRTTTTNMYNRFSLGGDGQLDIGETVVETRGIGGGVDLFQR
ncbi:hypothetical protein QVD17_19318 [Tagetes erecta]|uniref:Uncharacterized protein n=1 Tax=Tagetes erecta TaxID=13708 RepID=A0AAD8NWU7_TARER|nr:hypothetical protein QVD17_19318 [Tagetes erecta]